MSGFSPEEAHEMMGDDFQTPSFQSRLALTHTDFGSSASGRGIAASQFRPPERNPWLTIGA